MNDEKPNFQETDFWVFCGATNTGRHQAGERILFFEFKSLVDGRVFRPNYGEFTEVKKVVNDLQKYADILWVLKPGEIKKIEKSYEEVKKAYDLLDTGKRTIVKKIEIMEHYNAGNPRLKGLESSLEKEIHPPSIMIKA